MNDPSASSMDSQVAEALGDPFQSWPNSDLLVEEEDRAFFARHYGAYAALFDWPELRALFVSYNDTAARARAHSRTFGIYAVIAGFISLAVAAMIPLMEEIYRTDTSPSPWILTVLGGIAAALGLVSVLIGYTQVLTGKEKARWLVNRFCAERLRQLHFQLIVNHLPLAVAATSSDAGMEAWLAFRATRLDQFRHECLRGVDDQIHALELDEAEDDPWLQEEWDHQGPTPESSEPLCIILKLLEHQRFGIQLRYAERKLRHGWYSPESQAEWVQKLSDTFTAVVLFGTILAGLGSIVAALWLTPGVRIHLVATLLAALASASVVGMRALKEGLLFSADTERFRWYAAAVRTLRRRFEIADPARQVFLLRELERAAYQEMRRFMMAATDARFVM